MAESQPIASLKATDDSTLLIGNPLARARAALPYAVEVEGDQLLWTRDPSDEAMDSGMVGFHYGESVNGAIWAFLDLVDQPAESFGDFARRFGVLGIRDDGLPATAPIGRSGPYPLQKRRDGVVWFRESIAAWRMYAVALRSVLAVATAARNLHQSSYKEVLHEYGLDRFTWETFGEPIASSNSDEVSGLYIQWSTFLSPENLAHYIDDADSPDPRTAISSLVTNTWVKYGSLVPVIAWENSQSHMTLSLGGSSSGFYPSNMLFSVLSAQQAALLTSDGFDRLDRCSACSRIFVPAIRPGRHTRAYCDEHKLEGERERKRRWARKVAAERRAKQEA